MKHGRFEALRGADVEADAGRLSANISFSASHPGQPSSISEPIAAGYVPWVVTDLGPGLAFRAL